MFLSCPLVQAQQAQTEFYGCDDHVKSVGLADNNIIDVSFTKLGNLHLCNVIQPMGTWNPQTCQSMQSLVTAAMLSGSKVRVGFHKLNNCDPKQTAGKSSDDLQLYVIEVLK
jgi:hypothetical protein